MSLCLCCNCNEESSSAGVALNSCCSTTRHISWDSSLSNSGRSVKGAGRTALLARTAPELSCVQRAAGALDIIVRGSESDCVPRSSSRPLSGSLLAATQVKAGDPKATDKIGSYLSVLAESLRGCKGIDLPTAKPSWSWPFTSEGDCLGLSS
eukprot:scaffold553265_cov51-Prasinocladus_malaysianus.AAC.2